MYIYIYIIFLLLLYMYYCITVLLICSVLLLTCSVLLLTCFVLLYYCIIDLLSVTVYVYIYIYIYMRNHLLSEFNILHTLNVLLLSLSVETGQLPGASLTQAYKTCIQLNFYLEILKGGHLGLGPPKCNPALYVQMSHPAPLINTNIECFLYYLAV